jgi:arsenate reductase
MRPDPSTLLCDNARKSCPVFSGDVQTAHWGFDDPADATGSIEERMAFFRRVRDEIKERISVYLSETN